MKYINKLFAFDDRQEAAQVRLSTKLTSTLYSVIFEPDYFFTSHFLPPEGEKLDEEEEEEEEEEDDDDEEENEASLCTSSSSNLSSRWSECQSTLTEDQYKHKSSSVSHHSAVAYNQGVGQVSIVSEVDEQQKLEQRLTAQTPTPLATRYYNHYYNHQYNRIGGSGCGVANANQNQEQPDDRQSVNFGSKTQTSNLRRQIDSEETRRKTTSGQRAESIKSDDEKQYDHNEDEDDDWILLGGSSNRDFSSNNQETLFKSSSTTKTANITNYTPTKQTTIIEHQQLEAAATNTTTKGLCKDLTASPKLAKKSISGSGKGGLIKGKRKGRGRSYYYLDEQSIKELRQMALDASDLELIKASWLPVRKDPSNAGVLLFKGLFTKFPKYLDFFPQFFDLDLERMHENKRLLRHATKVLDTVGYLVDSIGDESKTQQLNEALNNLVESHLRRKIGLTEFRNLGIVLIDFICDVNHRRDTILATSSSSSSPSSLVTTTSCSKEASASSCCSSTHAPSQANPSSLLSAQSDAQASISNNNSLRTGGVEETASGGRGSNVVGGNNCSNNNVAAVSGGVGGANDDLGSRPYGEANQSQNTTTNTTTTIVQTRIDTSGLVAAWTKLYGSILDLVKRLQNDAS